jgi:lipopolysaccharide transport system ATP-binding protein
MGSEAIIRVERLGKRYPLGRLRDQRYIALRDVLVEKATRLFRWNRGTTQGKSAREEFWALKDLSFEVKEGQVIGIIGRNGAGKSTLLKILSRITEPSEGRVGIRGRVASLLEVGTGFHPELTGRENIFLNGAILGMTREEIRKKFDDIVAFAETDKFLDTPVKHYSSGMYVRLAFAVAAQLEPEILLVDEVLAVGDAQFQKKCLGKMQAVSRSGRTVLFVSHNMAMVRALCDEAILLERGRISSKGAVPETIEKYVVRGAGRTSSEPLEPQQHALNTGEIWIDRLTLTNGEGNPLSEVQWGAPISILFGFDVRTAVRGLRFGIGFNTPEGVRVATLHHTDNGEEPIHLEPGRYEMSLSVINPLLPGQYVISIGAHRALGGFTVEYIPEALAFNVIDVGGGWVRHGGHYSGIVKVDGTWRLPERV